MISISRFWSFTASTKHVVSELPILVFILRIIPILVIIGYLIALDFFYSMRGVKAIFNNIYFFSIFLYVLVSFLSGYLIYQDTYCMWKSVEVFCLVYLFASLYSIKMDRNQSIFFFKKIFKFLLLLMFFTGLSALVFTEIAFPSNTYQIHSVIPPMNPNALGTIVLIVLYFCHFFYRQKYSKPIVLTYLYLLFVLALSRTAYIGFIFIVILFLNRIVLKGIIHNKLNKVLAYIYIGGLIFFSIFISFRFENAANFVARGQDTEMLSKMSHRAPMWKAAQISVLQAPFFGYGILAETRRLHRKYPEIMTFGKKTGFGNVHNSYLEIILGAGLIGGGLYVVIFLKNFMYSILYITLSRDKKDNCHLLVCMVLIALFFRFLTGSPMSYLSFELIIYFSIIALRLLPWQKSY